MAGTPEFYLTGGATNADPNLSLGGDTSSELLSTTALNALFDNVTPEEAEAGDVEYRVLALKNTGDVPLTNIEIFISQETPSPSTSIDLGYDTTTQVLADESTAPANVTFDHYIDSNRLSIPDIDAGAEVRIYFKRIVQAGAENSSNDTCKFKIVYA